MHIEGFRDLMMLAVGIAIVNNMVLAKFLGLCPFIGVTKKVSSAVGMGIAVTFVMGMTSAVTWVIYYYLLLPGDQNLLGGFSEYVRTAGLVDVLRTTSYILVIAAMVQLVEMVMKKRTPALYRALGIYLPLITTNCAVLGVALLNTTDAPAPLSLVGALVQGIFGGVGFMIAMLLMSGIRQQLEAADIPRPLQGTPIAFICTSLMALAFMGFSGMAR